MSGPLTPPRPQDANVRVRAATSRDLEALLRIETLSFASDRLNRRSLRRFVTSPTADLLVAEAEEILGYTLAISRKDSQATRLYSLAVLPGMVGRGVGSRLLRAAEAAASRRGAERLQLEVRADNDAAVRFYERHGYHVFGRVDDYYADGMAALRMLRLLDSKGTKAVLTGASAVEIPAHG
jgi:ribosomal protein S18 acetylase RimI-like enzyme